jgi:TP901 family phage tail tape measure protein/lambda family phage tail tape measure protein
MSNENAILTTGIDTSGFIAGLKEMQAAQVQFVSRMESLATLMEKSGTKNGRQFATSFKAELQQYGASISGSMAKIVENAPAYAAAGTKNGKAFAAALERAAAAGADDVADTITASVSRRMNGVTFSYRVKGTDARSMLSGATAKSAQLGQDLNESDFTDDQLRSADLAMRALDNKRKAEAAGIVANKALMQQKEAEELATFDRAINEIERKRKAEAAGIVANKTLAKQKEAEELATYDRAIDQIEAKRKAEAAGIVANKALARQKEAEELATFDRAINEIEAKRKAEAAGIVANKTLAKQKEAEELATFDRAIDQIEAKRKAEAAGIVANKALMQQKEAEELATFDRAINEIERKRKAEAAGIVANAALRKQQAAEALQLQQELTKRLEDGNKSDLKLISQQRAARRAAAEEQRKMLDDLVQANARYAMASPRTQFRLANVAQARLALPGADRGVLEAKYGSEALNANVDGLRKVAEASNKGRGSMAAWAKGANEAHSAARGLAGGLGVLWLTWGSTIPIAAGAALGSSLAAVFTKGKELEYQLRFVSELTDGMSISFGSFFGAMGDSMVAPLEAAKGLRALAQSGLDTRQSLAALKPTLDLAVVGELDVAAAAYAATGAMHAFGMGFSELTRIGDVFAKAAAISNTSVQGITEAMKQASTVAEFYGITLEETGASLAILAKRNIEGSAAGTAFRNMMVELATPTDKSRAAMKRLGLELYDSEKQLKAFPVVMEDLFSSLAQLDEKSRLAALNDIFNERGVKAAAALLADFPQLNKLIKELGDSAGYTSGVVSGLTDTVEGQLKTALKSLTQTFAGAFEESAASTKNLVRALGDLAGSQGFKDMVLGATQATITLTRTLVENRGVVLTIIGAWAGLKVISAVGPAILVVSRALGGLSLAAAGASVSVTGLGAAAAVAWRFLTGPIGLILTLAAAFVTLRQDTSNAGETIKANSSFLSDLAARAKEAADSQASLNRELAERNRLLANGQDPNTVKPSTVTRAEQQLREAEGRRVLIDDEIRKAQKEADKYKVRVGGFQLSGGPVDFLLSKDDRARKEAADKNLSKLLAERDGLVGSLGKARKDLSALKADSERDRTEKEIGAAEADLERRLNEANNLNAKIKALEDRGGKGLPAKIDLKSLPKMDADSRVAEIERVRKALEVKSYTPSERGAKQEAGRIVAAKLKSAEDLFRDEVEIAQMKHDKELWLLDQQLQYRAISEKQYNEMRLAESDRFLGEIARSEAAAQEKVSQIKSTAERESSKERLAGVAEQIRRTLQMKALKEELDKDKKPTQLELQGDDAIRNINESLPSVRQRALKASQDTLISKDKGLGSSVEIAGIEAARQATTAYNEALERASKVKEDLTVVFGEGSDAVKRAIEAEQGIKDAMFATANQASANAKEVARYYRTTEYGAKKAFAEYLDQSSNAAKMTEDLFSKAFTGMEDALATFVTTGKLDFASLAQSLIADMVRIQIRADAMKIMGMGGGMGGGGGGSGGVGGLIQAGLGLWNTFQNGGSSWNPLSGRSQLSSPGGWARGGAFGKYGTIDAFAKGDMFSRPTMFRHGKDGLGVMGEAGPESVMPLKRGPDGVLGVRATGVKTSGEAAPAPAPQSNIRIVNAFDTSVIGDYIGSAEGEKVVMNIVKNNPGMIRQMVRS